MVLVKYMLVSGNVVQPLMLKLAVIKLGIEAAARHKLAVISLLDDVSVTHDKYHICGHYG